MHLNPRVNDSASGSLATSYPSRRGDAVISATHQLLSDLWTADVEALESAIGRFRTDGILTTDCEVACFEIAGDRQLHVNVTHRYATRAAKGWAGPGRMPHGFVHNRRFVDIPRSAIIRHVRDMVFATRM